MTKKKEQAVIALPGASIPSGAEAVDMRALRRETLIAGGLLVPREKKYKSDAEKKAARSARGKTRRTERRKLLEEKGLVTPKTKLSKEQKKERSKARRASFNAFLRGNPEEAAKLGIDPSRRKV